jgi:hypothetical protein
MNNAWIVEASRKRLALQNVPITNSIRQKLPKKSCIVIGLDVSGSTDNRFSGGRGGVRGTRFNFRDDEENEKTDEVEETDKELKSETIIVMEILGVAEVLRGLNLQYDLDGVDIVIYVFGSATRNVFVRKEESVEEIITLLPQVVADNYTSDSTNLFSFFFKSLKEDGYGEYEGKIMTIIATDGHANTGGSISDILSQIEKEYFFSKSTHERLEGYIIGAGSIQVNENVGSRFRSVFTPSGTRFEVDGTRFDRAEDVLRRHGSGDSSSECNLHYLLSLMSGIGNAVYLASCTDLSLLRESLKSFLNEKETEVPKQKKVWKVKLDSGLIPLKPEVSSYLNDGKAVISYVEPASTWYLYVRTINSEKGWQVALTKTSGLFDTSKHYTYHDEFLETLSYEDAWECHSKFEVEFRGGTFNISNDGKYWRCRPLYSF